MAERVRVNSLTRTVLEPLIKKVKTPDQFIEFEEVAKRVTKAILEDTDLQNAEVDDMFWDEMLDNEPDDVTPDELLGATGEFGRVKTNPIPVNGLLGEVIYLSKLREGKKKQIMVFHRIGSTHTEVSKKPIDVFELVSVDGWRYDILYLDPYHVECSKKAPEGYVLADKIDYITGDCIGPNPKFPKGVPDRVAQYSLGVLGTPAIHYSIKDLHVGRAQKTVNAGRDKVGNLDINATISRKNEKVTPDNYKALTEQEANQIMKDLKNYKTRHPEKDRRTKNVSHKEHEG